MLNILGFLRPWERNNLKIISEKEKMLATYFLIPYLFNDLEKKERFEIIVGKGKNHGKPASSNPTTLSTLPKTNLSFSVTFILLSAKQHNFKLFQINPFPNKPWFLRICSTSLMKTLWKQKKLLVTSNFSSFHSVSTFLVKFLPFS